MTLVQEATEIMERMQVKNQELVLELLRMMNPGEALLPDAEDASSFRRTGKADFNLPADFDEHFDDTNDEIAVMFYGGEG